MLLFNCELLLILFLYGVSSLLWELYQGIHSATMSVIFYTTILFRCFGFVEASAQAKLMDILKPV